MRDRLFKADLGKSEGGPKQIFGTLAQFITQGTVKEHDKFKNKKRHLTHLLLDTLLR